MIALSGIKWEDVQDLQGWLRRHRKLFPNLCLILYLLKKF